MAATRPRHPHARPDSKSATAVRLSGHPVGSLNPPRSSWINRLAIQRPCGSLARVLLYSRAGISMQRSKMTATPGGRCDSENRQMLDLLILTRRVTCPTMIACRYLPVLCWSSARVAELEGKRAPPVAAVQVVEAREEGEASALEEGKDVRRCPRPISPAGVWAPSSTPWLRARWCQQGCPESPWKSRRMERCSTLRGTATRT